MKKLILIRHAKSDWGNIHQKDFDRSLNARGLRDAPFMAHILKEYVSQIDKIISSPANRANTTCNFFADEFEYPKTNIEFDRGIYEDGQKTILSILGQLDNSINTVALFGHNPDITATATFLAGERIDNIPTCGIISINFDFDDWTKVTKVNGKKEFFLFPKLYFKDAELD